MAWKVTNEIVPAGDVATPHTALRLGVRDVRIG